MKNSVRWTRDIPLALPTPAAARPPPLREDSHPPGRSLPRGVGHGSLARAVGHTDLSSRGNTALPIPLLPSLALFPPAVLLGVSPSRRCISPLEQKRAGTSGPRQILSVARLRLMENDNYLP